MKNFIKNHKKTCIALGVFILIFLVFFIWIFVLPLFSNNKYGDRLENIGKYKISNNTVNSVKSALKENEGVTDVDYHKEGRILNFIITIDGDENLDKVKSYTKGITDNLDEKIKKYYDIEVFIDTKGDSEVYPIIGYLHKGGEDFSWSNVGEKNE